MKRYVPRRWFAVAAAVGFCFPADAQLLVRRDFIVGGDIPDYDGVQSVGLVDKQMVTLQMPGATIDELRVRLNVQGRVAEGFNGDLYAHLSHSTVEEDSAGFAVLLNRPGYTGGGSLGYSDNGLNVILRSDADANIHTYQEAEGFDLISSFSGSGQLIGVWQPDNSTLGLADGANLGSLESFQGFTPNGGWTLYVEDRSDTALHRLASWGLEFLLSIGDEAALTFGGDDVIEAHTPSQVFANAITLTSGAYTVIDGLNDLEFTGTIEGEGGFVKRGEGTFRLSNGNTFQGGFEIHEGKVEIGHVKALGDGEVTLAGGTLAPSTGSSNLEIDNPITLSSDSKIEVPSSGEFRLSGSLSGDALFEKIGTGKLVLSSDSPAFNGVIQVNDGEVDVSADLSNSTVNLQPGSKLGGTGTIGGVTVEGATLSPGASPGTLTVDGDTLLKSVDGVSSGYEWEINDPAGTKGGNPGWDWIHITGRLTLDASITAESPFEITALKTGDLTLDQVYTWTILTSDEGIYQGGDPFAYDASLFELDQSQFAALGSLELSMSGDNQSLNLTFTPVPEPEQVALAAGAALALFAMARRRWMAARA